MSGKRYMEEQIIYSAKQADAGTTVKEICRQLGVSEPTFYAWEKKSGGMGVSELRELRQLRDENQRLKRLVADLTLEKHFLQEVLSTGIAGSYENSRNLISVGRAPVSGAGLNLPGAKNSDRTLPTPRLPEWDLPGGPDRSNSFPEPFREKTECGKNKGISMA